MRVGRSASGFFYLSARPDQFDPNHRIEQIDRRSSEASDKWRR